MLQTSGKVKNSVQLNFIFVSLNGTNKKIENEILLWRHKNLSATSDKIHPICLHHDKVEQKGNQD